MRMRMRMIQIWKLLVFLRCQIKVAAYLVQLAKGFYPLPVSPLPLLYRSVAWHGARAASEHTIHNPQSREGLCEFLPPLLGLDQEDTGWMIDPS
jgi:hypothetical protein